MNWTSALVVGLASLLPSWAFTQDLEYHIKPGDKIFVTDRQGQELSGRLTSLSPDTLRVLTRGGEREVPRRDVGRIEKPDSVWDGAAIGAAIFAFGFAGGAGASCSPHCTSAVTFSTLAGAALGGYIGARVDKALPGQQLVWGRAPDSAFALAPSAPIRSSADLWTRLKYGDRIRVLETTGLETDGKFDASSASSISIVDGGRREDIPAQKVLQVTRRSSYVGLGTLAGLGLGLTTAAAGVCQNDVFIACPLDGALVGAIIGRLIHRQVVVYRSENQTSSTSAWVPSVLPIVTSSTKAVMLTFSRREGR